MTSDVQRRKAMKRVRGTEALRWLRHVLKWLGLGAGVALGAGVWLGAMLLGTAPAAIQAGAPASAAMVRVFDPVPPGGLCAATERCRVTKGMP